MEAKVDENFYVEMVKAIADKYEVQFYAETNHVAEFFEGEIPLFKLLFSPEQDGMPAITALSFNLELTSPYAIHWFLRVREIDPNVNLTVCYLRDGRGFTYVGHDAELLRMQAIEKHAVTQFLLDQRKMVERAGLGPQSEPEKPKAFSVLSLAVADFERPVKKNDIFH